MAISPLCRGCKKELDAPGAILLGPPTTANFCSKDHLCKTCYQLACGFIDGLADGPTSPVSIPL